MKKFLSILLSALCALLPTLALAQESTTLLTTVPSEHTITIVCGAHGKVVIDGKTYSGTFTIQADRLGTLTIKAQPSSGYGLSQVKVDDMDGVTVKGRKVTLSGINCENTVTLTFYKLPAEVTPTPTVAPTATPVPEPTVTGEPTLADTVRIPEISATGNVLYDDFLGTGSGLGQLSIVFDGEYQPQDYELLNVKPDSETQKNTVLVRAYPDENGEVAHRSLTLSAAQLVRLAQKQQTQHLIFENGEAAMTVDLADLLSGNVQKLVGLMVRSSKVISTETLNRDWSEVETVTLSAAELATVKVEIRIIPVELADGSIAYDISVWLRWDDQELEISSMLPSLRVCLNVDDETAGQYAVGYQAENTEGFLPLDSMPARIPEEMPENQPDVAEKFIVTMPEEEGGILAVAYDADTPLSQERHSVVTATYASKGCYQLLNVE